MKLINLLKQSHSKNGFGLVTPYIACIGQTSSRDRVKSVKQPISTVVSKQEHMLVAPTLIQYHTETSKQPRGQGLETPIQTLDSSNRYGLVAAFISKYYAGNYQGSGADLESPTPTITTKDHNALVTAL
jgi:DNA (cytosine-5)-methyltransferase 1